MAKTMEMVGGIVPNDGPHDITKTSGGKSVTWPSNSQLEETHITSVDTKSASLVSTLTASSVDENPTTDPGLVGIVQEEATAFLESTTEAMSGAYPHLDRSPAALVRTATHSHPKPSTTVATKLPAIYGKGMPHSWQATMTWSDTEQANPGFGLTNFPHEMKDKKNKEGMN